MTAVFDKADEVSSASLYRGCGAVLPGVDVESILQADDGSLSFRRNFIRVACVLGEGYASCFPEICAIGLETGSDGLMHPKSMEDLAISDAQWEKIHEGTQWLFAQLFGLVDQLRLKHDA